MNINNNWIQIKKGGVYRTPKISFSKGNAKYIIFNPSFNRTNNLIDMKSVKILHKEVDGKLQIGFVFYKTEEETYYKISWNESQAGYISASGLFGQLKIVPKLLSKTEFEPTEEVIENEKMFIIEVDKNEF